MEENIALGRLKKDFISRYERSQDKETLLMKEIEGYSLIFDVTKLPLDILSTEDEPLNNYFIPYSSMQIFIIREFNNYFIVYGNDLSEIEEHKWDSWLVELKEFALDYLIEPNWRKDYYNLTIGLNYYLKWLRAPHSFTINEKLYDQLGIGINDFESLPKKEYNSLMRARAFCIMEMLIKGKFPKDVIESKKKIIETVKKAFPGQSGKTIYETLKTKERLYIDYDNKKNEYAKDYEYGLKLYKEKYPD